MQDTNKINKKILSMLAFRTLLSIPRPLSCVLGINYTSATIPVDTLTGDYNMRSGTYGSGRFVFPYFDRGISNTPPSISSQKGIITSNDDGNTWTYGDLIGFTSLDAVDSTNQSTGTKYVACGSLLDTYAKTDGSTIQSVRPRMWYSTDATTWTLATTPAGNAANFNLPSDLTTTYPDSASAIVHNKLPEGSGGVWIVTTGVGGGIIRSTDGINWTYISNVFDLATTTNDNTSFFTAAYSPLSGKWFIAGSSSLDGNTYTPLVMSSSDAGLTWTQISIAFNSIDTFVSIAAVNNTGTIVLHTDHDGTWLSTNEGGTFTSQTTTGLGEANTMVFREYFDGVFYAVNEGADSGIYQSTDGINWIIYPVPISDQQYYVVGLASNKNINNKVMMVSISQDVLFDGSHIPDVPLWRTTCGTQYTAPYVTQITVNRHNNGTSDLISFNYLYPPFGPAAQVGFLPGITIPIQTTIQLEPGFFLEMDVFTTLSNTLTISGLSTPYTSTVTKVSDYQYTVRITNTEGGITNTTQVVQFEAFDSLGNTTDPLIGTTDTVIISDRGFGV